MFFSSLVTQISLLDDVSLPVRDYLTRNFLRGGRETLLLFLPLSHYMHRFQWECFHCWIWQSCSQPMEI